MADITKRTRRRVGRYLDAGEIIEIALLCEPRGTYGMGMFQLAHAPGPGQKAMNKRLRRRRADQIGIVEMFPAEPCVVAVSADRFLAFPSNGMYFRRPFLAIPRTQVLVGEVGRRGLGHVLQLVFRDGSGIDVDVQMGQPVAKLVAALGTVAPIR